MATGGCLDLHDTGSHESVWTSQFADNLQEQKDEVMVLQSMFGDQQDERFRVVTEAPESISNDFDGNPNMYSLQLSVPIRWDGDKIHVDVCVPASELYQTDTEVNKGPPTRLMRSESGRQLMGTFEVQYLTPVNLSVVLPPEYPSCGPPYFTISCHWMSPNQLSVLGRMLDSLWKDSASMPILFTWIDWLENNCCSYLCIDGSLTLNQTEPDGEVDPRAVQETENIDEAIEFMLRYDRQMEIKTFCINNQDCLVCYIDGPGSEFFRLNQCKHHFCHECMKSYCSLHVKEGTVLELLCPEHDCKNEIPPYIIKKVLTDEEYERWERITLMKGLDKMGDILWCERCNAPVIHDKNDTSCVAHCLNCSYAFCTKCKEAAHQGTRCTNLQDKINALQKHMEKAEEVAIKLEIQRLIEEKESRKYLEDRARRCPSCTVPVVKISGCNKVVCTNCNKSMCWGCGMDITKQGYEHFRLFPNCAQYHLTYDDDNDGPLPPIQPLFRRPIQQRNEFDINLDIRLRHDPIVAKRVKRCPVCKQRSLQAEDGNNHIKCWNCKTNFCFLCDKRIIGPVHNHFKPPSLCKQHIRIS